MREETMSNNNYLLIFTNQPPPTSTNCHIMAKVDKNARLTMERRML